MKKESAFSSFFTASPYSIDGFLEFNFEESFIVSLASQTTLLFYDFLIEKPETIFISI